MTDEVKEDPSASETGQQYLDKLRLENRGKFDQIRAYGAELDSNSVLMLRLDTFISMALNAEDKIRFETQFEQSMTEALDNALKQVKQQALRQGVTPGSSPLLGPDGNPAR